MKLSMLTKRIPFTLETEDGDVELFITQFTVADGEYREKLMKDHWEVQDNDYLGKLNSYNLARIMVSVKKADGGYYFTGSVDETRVLLGIELANALCSEVDKLNPIPMPDETLDTKKKKS